MADVSIGPPDGDRLFGGEDTSNADRAQLLLVAGLVMAVSLVTLVVLLNATIYSENVATRGIESADGEALEVRATAVDGTGELLDATNRAGPTDHADAAETVRNGVKDLDREASRSYAERGGVARIELLEIRNGSRITTDMAAVDPNASTLAADVDRTRGFVLDVDPGSLVETNASGAVDNAFHVELNDSTGGTHQVYVYNGTDGNVTVAVGDNSGEPTVWCETPPDGRDRVAVDLTGERLGGRSLSGDLADSSRCTRRRLRHHPHERERCRRRGGCDRARRLRGHCHHQPHGGATTGSVRGDDRPPLPDRGASVRDRRSGRPG